MNRPLQIVAAAFTPFHADGSLDTRRIARQAEALARDGVDGAFVCGTTGEGAALTGAERRAVVEAWVAAAPAGLRIIAHVGHASTAEAAELAAHAQSAGAHAVAAVPPYFLKPTTAETVVASLAPIAAAAPRLPFLHYHIPSVTGVTVPAHEVARLAIGRIPNFAGSKFTDADLGDLGRLADVLGTDRELYFGRDDMLLPAMSLGIRAAVGMSFNFTGPVVRALGACFDARDLGGAARHQRTLRDLLLACAPHGLVAGLKGLSGHVGVDCGPVRPPLATLATDAALSLEAALNLRATLGRVDRAEPIAA